MPKEMEYREFQKKEKKGKKGKNKHSGSAKSTRPSVYEMTEPEDKRTVTVGGSPVSQPIVAYDNDESASSPDQRPPLRPTDAHDSVGRSDRFSGERHHQRIGNSLVSRMYSDMASTTPSSSTDSKSSPEQSHKRQLRQAPPTEVRNIKVGGLYSDSVDEQRQKTPRPTTQGEVGSMESGRGHQAGMDREGVPPQSGTPQSGGIESKVTQSGHRGRSHPGSGRPDSGHHGNKPWERSPAHKERNYQSNEESRKRSRSTSGDRQDYRTRRFQEGITCHKCKTLGHYARDCDKDSSNITCHKCKSLGHYARDCGKDGKSVTCFKCYTPGHYAKDCVKSSTKLFCRRCPGDSSHNTANCPVPFCYICKQKGHKFSDDNCDAVVRPPHTNHIRTIKGREDILSNFYDCPMSVDGHTLWSSENVYHYRKALIAGDEDTAGKFIRAGSALEGKTLSKELKDKLPEDWDWRKAGVMREVLRAKLDQVPEFREELLSTGDKWLAHSLTDRYWGTGLSTEETVIAKRDYWPGRNVHGLMLMELRDEITGARTLESPPDYSPWSSYQHGTPQRHLSTPGSDGRSYQSPGSTPTGPGVSGRGWRWGSKNPSDSEPEKTAQSLPAPEGTDVNEESKETCSEGTSEKEGQTPPQTSDEQVPQTENSREPLEEARVEGSGIDRAETQSSEHIPDSWEDEEESVSKDASSFAASQMSCENQVSGEGAAATGSSMCSNDASESWDHDLDDSVPKVHVTYAASSQMSCDSQVSGTDAWPPTPAETAQNVYGPPQQGPALESPVGVESAQHSSETPTSSVTESAQSQPWGESACVSQGPPQSQGPSMNSPYQQRQDSAQSEPSGQTVTPQMEDHSQQHNHSGYQWDNYGNRPRGRGRLRSGNQRSRVQGGWAVDGDRKGRRGQRSHQSYEAEHDDRTRGNPSSPDAGHHQDSHQGPWDKSPRNQEQRGGSHAGSGGGHHGRDQREGRGDRGRRDRGGQYNRQNSDDHGRGQARHQEMDPAVRLKKFSRSLSNVLRHRAEKMGFKIHEGGFIDVEELLNHEYFSKFNHTLEELHSVVETDDKKWFHMEKGEDGRLMIRANQEMDPAERLEKFSRSLSSVLRHLAEKMGFKIHQGGFIDVEELLNHEYFSKFNYTLEELHSVVNTNDKKRFHMEKGEDGRLMIRANQGHTMDVEVDLTPVKEPSKYPDVVHGTYRNCLDGIMKKGLSRMSRQHIHFAPGLPDNQKVLSGMRSTCDVIILIDMEAAMKDGIQFFLSDNNVILTAGDKDGYLPTKYFTHVLDRFSRASIAEVKK